jgi:hypothetical protein
MKLECDLVSCREQLGPAGYCYNKLTSIQFRLTRAKISPPQGTDSAYVVYVLQ